MVGWSAVAGAVVLGIVLLGFCAYELIWKLRRLRVDLVGLQQLSKQLESAQRELGAVQRRLQTTGRADR